jgi:beta-lysine 5,6-aminomutase beta subunit
MGLDPALVVHAKGIGERFTFFVVYGRSPVIIDLDEVEVVEREFPLLTTKEVNLEIRSRLRRRMVIVGATVGTDAHTVGLDAICNVKGFAGEKGLESYRELRVVNLGAQVDAGELVARALRERADAVLVSQVVTQRDAHLQHVREVAEALDAGWPADRPRPLLLVGGPRFDPAAAAELGADRVFTKGTTPREVASFLVHRLSSSPQPVSA